MLLLLACAGEPTESPPPEDTALVPSPYIQPEGDPPTPSLDEAQISAALDVALAEVMSVRAQPVVDGYERAMENQEEGCPDYYESDGNTYWYDYCTSENGAYFSGYGFIYGYTDYDGGDGYLYTGTQMYMVADITTPEGWRFQGGGSASNLRLFHQGTGGDDVTHTVYYNVLQGAFAWDGPEAAGTWLESELSPTLTLYAYVIPEGEIYSGEVLAIEGGLDGLDGEVGTVVFDGVQTVSASLGNTCTAEPIGTISVRDTEGGWYDVVFDNALPWEGGALGAEECDGCGTVWYRGVEVGQACTDASALLDWKGEAPW